MPQTDEQRAVLDELNRRRDSLTPEKQAIIDELNLRYQGQQGPTMVPNQSQRPQQPGLLRRIEDRATLPTGNTPAGMGIASTLPNPGAALGAAVGAVKGLGRGLFGHPDTPAQEFGQAAERGLEYYGASAGAAALTGGASLPVQIAAQGGAAGLTAASQGGGAGDIGLAAGLGAAGPPLARAAGAAGNYISSRMSARQINSVLGVPARMLRNADDLGPGARLQQDGVSATTKQQLLSKVNQHLDDAGQAIGRVMESSDEVFQNVDDVAFDVYQGQPMTRLRPAEVRQMNRDWEWISNNLPDHPMSASELQQFHTSLGRQVVWTGKSADKPANQAMKDVYFRINDLIEDRIPGAKELWGRWRDYNIARSALDPAIRRLQTSAPVSGTLMGTVNRATRAAPTTIPAGLIGRATSPSAVESMIQATRAARSGLMAERAR